MATLPDVPDPYERRGVPHPHRLVPAGRDVEGADAQLGGVSAMGLPFDLTDEEADEYLTELRDRQARRRPPGFAAWPVKRRRV